MRVDVVCGRSRKRWSACWSFSCQCWPKHVPQHFPVLYTHAITDWHYKLWRVSQFSWLFIGAFKITIRHHKPIYILPQSRFRCDVIHDWWLTFIYLVSTARLKVSDSNFLPVYIHKFMTSWIHCLWICIDSTTTLFDQESVAAYF